MADVRDRLKILIDSSTPIVVIETAEEVRAVRMVREAAATSHLAVFEWTIAAGLVRSGAEVAAAGADMLSPGPTRATLQAADEHAAIYNSREPAQALGTIAAINLEAVFILKDFHRHLEDPVVVRRLRDVGQQFSTHRRTVVITAPSITIPPELSDLVEFVDLPLPDKTRLHQIVDEVFLRLSQNRTLRRSLDSAGLDAAINNLRGLTEDEAERALSQALVRLVPETVTDLLEAKK